MEKIKSISVDINSILTKLDLKHANFVKSKE